jgi:hypothetical protein
LFRQAVKGLTQPVPAPKKSRRRGGETNRQFAKAANRLTRFRTRAFAAIPWLADTLDWLGLWQPAADVAESTEDHAAREPNHLLPRL